MILVTRVCVCVCFFFTLLTDRVAAILSKVRGCFPIRQYVHGPLVDWTGKYQRGEHKNKRRTQKQKQDKNDKNKANRNKKTNTKNYRY